MWWPQSLAQPFLAREKRRETDRQTGRQPPGQGSGVGTWPAQSDSGARIESGQIGHSEYGGGWGSPLSCPFPCKPSSRLCADRKLRAAKVVGRGANAAEHGGGCRGQTLPPLHE